MHGENYAKTSSTFLPRYVLRYCCTCSDDCGHRVRGYWYCPAFDGHHSHDHHGNAGSITNRYTTTGRDEYPGRLQTRWYLLHRPRKKHHKHQLGDERAQWAYLHAG